MLLQRFSLLPLRILLLLERLLTLLTRLLPFRRLLLTSRLRALLRLLLALRDLLLASGDCFLPCLLLFRIFYIGLLLISLLRLVLLTLLRKSRRAQARRQGSTDDKREHSSVEWVAAHVDLQLIDPCAWWHRVSSPLRRASRHGR